MDVAVIGAGGACGRQLCMQLLERRIVPSECRLQLVGRRGGPSEHELWGLRADLRDAFSEWAPAIEVALDPEAVEADVVVMLAGATISTDPAAATDRAALARTNAAVFESYARPLGRRGTPPIVIAQSNPVELAVDVFARHLEPHRVLGAGAHSDSLRFTREIAADLGVSSRAVQAMMLGQHGDHVVPLWSQVEVRGVETERLASYVAAARGGHALADLPMRIREARAAMLSAIQAGHVEAAFEAVQAHPADVRAAVKPFFTHFTTGHTTEAVTARSVADIVHALVEGLALVMPAQVRVEASWTGTLDVGGVVGLPVLLGRRGWTQVLPLPLADDERQAMRAAAAAIAGANAPA